MRRPLTLPSAHPHAVASGARFTSARAFLFAPTALDPAVVELGNL